MNLPGTLAGNWCWRCAPGAMTEELARRLGQQPVADAHLLLGRHDVHGGGDHGVGLLAFAAHQLRAADVLRLVSEQTPGGRVAQRLGIVIECGALGVVLRATTAAPLYLNGQPVLAAPLRHGDLISIGDLRIMVELHARSAQPTKPVWTVAKGKKGVKECRRLHQFLPPSPRAAI